MKSLQNKLNLIKEGKGNKELFLKEARTMFPNVVTGALTFDQAVHNLTERGILSEGFIGLSSKKPNNPDWFSIFNENVKAELKDTDKDVEKLETAGYDYKDEKNSNNLSMESILAGYYAEMKDPKNAEKTEEELKEMVVKNLEKDPMHYMKDGAFGVKGIGYTDEAPGLKASDTDKMMPVKLSEAMYASSDGDYEHDMETEIKANEYYDRGMEAYSEGDFLKADRYYQAALKAGAWLGWDESDLPPYGDNHLGENTRLTEAKNKAMEKAVKEIEKKSELAKAEAKVSQIDELISELEAKLSMTEAEGVSEIVDKNKVKEIQKNIKFLEGKKKKYEKEKARLEGKYGEKKKEVMDEELETPNEEAGEQVEKMGYAEAVKEMLKRKGLKK